MKSFESVGVWFLPDEPDNQVTGTVTFSQDDGFRLKLTGSFQDNWASEVPGYPAIRGVVSDSPYGKFVSLFDCFATNLRIGMPGISLETIHANQGFAGSDFVQSKAMPFNEAAVYFSTLPSWLNYTGLKVDAFTKLNNIDASWLRPESLYCHLDGARISTAFDFSANESFAPRSVLIQENPAFLLDGLGDVTVEDIQSRFVAPLSRLMAFASENTVKLDRYRLFAKTEEDGNIARFDWLFSPSTKSKTKSVDPLFTLADVPGGFEPFLKSWFSFIQAHPDFCSIFFSYGYEKHGFVETRFLFQMLAAECLVREEMTDRKMIQPFEKLRADMLMATPLSNTPHAAFTLPTAVQLAMPTLFAQFINDRWALVNEIVGTTEERFLEALFTTMEYVNQRGDRQLSVIRGSNLMWLTERLAAILKISVLMRLGFADEKINELVTSNAEINHLKTINAPWGQSETIDDNRGFSRQPTDPDR